MKLDDIDPNQEITIIGNVQNGYILWKDAQKTKIKDVVKKNIEYNPDNPFDVYVREINLPTNAASLINSQEDAALKDALAEVLILDEDSIWQIMHDIDKLEAKELQDKVHQLLVDLEHPKHRVTLQQTHSSKKVALLWPSEDCNFGDKGCSLVFEKKCTNGFTLVNAGPIMFGKCLKDVTPKYKQCPAGSQKVLNRFDPTALNCKEVREAIPCPKGFEEEAPLKCKQEMKCSEDQEMIMDGPNTGMCKRKN